MIDPQRNRRGDDDERRLQILEIKLEALSTSFNSTQQEFAAMRETVRIYTDFIQSFTDDLEELKRMVLQHFQDEARDRAKMFVGLVTSAMAGLGTLGVLIWGVFQYGQKLTG